MWQDHTFQLKKQGNKKSSGGGGLRQVSGKNRKRGGSWVGGGSTEYRECLHKTRWGGGGQHKPSANYGNANRKCNHTIN